MMTNRARLVVAVLAGALLATAGSVRAAVATGDEFVGPFASWVNVKTAYGAKGDGVKDDTAALQAALNAIGRNGMNTVLWVPSGNYKITSQLTLAHVENVSVIGEDPATTLLKWAGPAGGTLLYINGIDHSRINRLTFEGSGTADSLVDQSWSGSGGHFDTGSEYADDYFQNAGIGIRGGFLGKGFAETTIIRDHFSNLTKAGVTLGNFNALDIWVRYSVFDHCYEGITNSAGAGSFEAYNNVFRHATSADLHSENTGQFSIRGNYSIGSNRFALMSSGTNNPSSITLHGNTILDTTQVGSVKVGNQGPVVLYDNVIRSLPANATGWIVDVSPFTNADVIALGNTFTRSSPYYAGGSFLDTGTSIVTADEVNPAEPVLPGTEPNFHRQVFDVPSGASAEAIQIAISEAATVSGSRPVVHIPMGVYSIGQTLEVPANTDLQVVGDGMLSTRLNWTGSGAGPVIHIAGPSKATFRSFLINGNGLADGIVADDIDQPGSRVFIRDSSLDFGRKTNIFVDGLDYTLVEGEDFQHKYQSFPESIGVKVVGGPLAASGNPQTGRVNIYSGASAGEILPYEVSDGGNLLARDVWYESSPSPRYLRATGRGAVTMEGLRVGVSSHAKPAFDISNFVGKINLSNLRTDGYIIVSGDGSQTEMLGAGLLGYATLAGISNFVQNNASPAATIGVLNSRTWSDNRLYRSHMATMQVDSFGPHVKKPSYAAASWTGSPAGHIPANWTWSYSTAEIRGLQKPEDPSDRILSTWYTEPYLGNLPFYLDVNITDDAAHQIALYALDHETGRAETIKVLDANTGAVLDTRSLPVGTFHDGEYAVWNVKGHVRFEIDYVSGYNAVISGYFFDPATGSLPSASPGAIFVKADTTTQGNWICRYGADGYNINGEAVTPAFVTSMYAQDRAAVQQPITALANDVTDLRMHRMAVTNGLNDIHLVGGGAPSHRR